MSRSSPSQPVPDASASGIERPPEALRGPASHDWEEITEKKARRCRNCGAVAIRGRGRDADAWVYAMRGQRFQADIPLCPAPQSHRAFEEDDAKVREAIWTLLNGDPEAIPSIEHLLNRPCGYLRGLAMQGEMDLVAVVAVLRHFGLDAGQFFRTIFLPGDPESVQ